MTEQLEYKGYRAVYFWDDDSNILFGNVANIQDVITFQGYTEEDFKQAFRDSIDDYLNFCKERGEEPEKPNDKKMGGLHGVIVSEDEYDPDDPKFKYMMVHPDIQAKMPPGSKTFAQLNMFETAWLEFKRFWGIK
jgi:predicted RNase H-like HicB family nuclease